MLEKRKDVFVKRNVMESFRFHPTLILLFLKECHFIVNFNVHICNELILHSSLNSVNNLMNFLFIHIRFFVFM